MSYIKQENTEYYPTSKPHPPASIGNGDHADYTQQGVHSAQNSITAFLAKLWALVNDPSCDDLIAWDQSGTSFHVYDQARFAREILPRYFKHNNFASFIRQLNMYGFRKMSTIEHGSLANERDDIEFAHPSFLRGQESLLESIKRRAPEPQQKLNLAGGNYALIPNDYVDPKTGRPIDFSHIITDVRNLQTKQTSLSDKLSYMQTENQALWNEIGSLRQKHNKQQQIVSKLMEFLLQFISSNSAPAHEQHVQQQPPHEVLGTDLHNQRTQNDAFNDQGLSPNTLKRKHAALMHNDEPNKRTTVQQPSNPPAFGRQQSVTINELTDHDASGWLHANSSPLIDLVPSPPAPTLNPDDNQYNLQQQRNLPHQNQSYQTVANGDKQAANPYVPDFVLTDNPNGTTDANNLTGINMSQPKTATQVPASNVVKREQNDYPNQSLDNRESSYSEGQHQHKIGGQPDDQLSFSLSDITGDVDHIQSSLDNIRDLMFEHLPENASLDDLFDDENNILSPLLQSVVTDKTLLENAQDQKLNTGDQLADPIDSMATSQSVPNVGNQILGKLINDSVLVGKQQKTIDQLARENSDLQERVHQLEQQQQQQQRK